MAKNEFQSDFGCAQHPKAGQDIQHLTVLQCRLETFEDRSYSHLVVYGVTRSLSYILLLLQIIQGGS